MSKENTQKFLADVVANDDLKLKLLGTNAAGWVTSAKTKGYEISVEELADELIGRIREMMTGELDESNLDAVTGGAGAPQVKAIATPALAANQAALKLAPQFRMPNKGAARW